MNQEQPKKEPLRKEGRKRGERTQVMTTFRLDIDLLKWLRGKENKGRYINNLIRDDMKNGTHK